MSDIIEILKNAPEYIGGIGRPDAEIESAEKQLGVEFAPDYKRYLKEIGLACFDGHELTGICKPPRLNVVEVTTAQREKHPEASSWYVIEETNVDGIVIWQNVGGKVYITAHNSKPKKIANSIAEYIQTTTE